MALGLSGFEMIMNVVPRVSGGADDDSGTPAGRIRNTRKLMVTAASIMAVYLISAVTGHHVARAASRTAARRHSHAPSTRLPRPRLASQPTAPPATHVNPLFGDAFGDLYDLSSAFILCLAGVSVTMGLQNLLPHYLNRLGMDVTWAGKSARHHASCSM